MEPVRFTAKPGANAAGDMVAPSPQMTQAAPLLPLLRAAHIGPGVAVTTVVALLAVAAELHPAKAAVVIAAVFTGQLTIGWSNDLLDASRDRESGRADKPLASGALDAVLVKHCLVVAVLACGVLSLLAGWRSGIVHLSLCVAFGHLYNLWFKATPLSWFPYAVAFGSLPAVVSLAGSPPVGPPGWMVLTAAALGIAAHFLNTLPDFEDDAATGIQGLPHRVGATGSRVIATALLVGASAAAVYGPVGPPSVAVWVAFGIVLILSMLALVGRGRVPFYAAIAIALVDVLLLTLVRL